MKYVFFFLLCCFLTACPSPSPGPDPNIKTYAFRFTEVLPNPDGRDIGNEYAIIRNISNDSAALAGWYYTGKEITRFTFDNTAKIPAGGEFRHGTGRTNEWLNNTLDTLRLYAPDNTLVQTITWANVGDGKVIIP